MNIHTAQSQVLNLKLHIHTAQSQPPEMTRVLSNCPSVALQQGNDVLVEGITSVFTVEPRANKTNIKYYP
jgi:hypothetical protein